MLIKNYKKENLAIIISANMRKFRIIKANSSKVNSFHYYNIVIKNRHIKKSYLKTFFKGLSPHP